MKIIEFSTANSTISKRPRSRCFSLLTYANFDRFNVVSSAHKACHTFEVVLMNSLISLLDNKNNDRTIYVNLSIAYPMRMTDYRANI